MARTRDVGVAIGRLLIAFGMENKEADEVMPDHKLAVYEKGWAHIPGPILDLATERWISHGRPFFPRVSDITHLAEQVRRELLAANQYDGCVECERSVGWAEVVIDGVRRVQRCGCWHRHQSKLANLGVTPEPLALPPGRDRDSDAELV